MQPLNLSNRPTLLRIRMHFLAFVAFLPALLSGCFGGGPNQSEVVEKLKTSPAHKLRVTNRHVTIISNSQQENHWNVEFECTEVPADDWLIELDRAAIEQDLASSLTKYQATVQKIAEVRWPERQKLVELRQQVDEFELPRVFRPVATAGEEITWRGRATVTEATSGLRVSGVTVVESPIVKFESLRMSNGIGAEGAVSDGGPDDPMVQMRELRNSLAEQLQLAKEAENARLQTEHKALLSLLKGETAVTGALPGRGDSEQTVELRFDVDESLNVVSAVAIDTNDTFERAVFTGELTLQPTSPTRPEAQHDGWRLKLSNADKNLTSLSRSMPDAVGVHFDSSTGRYFLTQQTRTATLAEQVGSAMKKPTARLADLLQLGAEAMGTESATGLADRRIKLTVTYFDEPTGNLRLLVEDQSSPFSFAVFEGKFRSQAPHHLGLPLQLKQVANAAAPDRSARDSLIFNNGGNYQLTILATESGFAGRYRNANLAFGEPTVNESVKDGSTRWGDMLATGSTWHGISQWRSDAVQEIMLRVAEVRDNGKCVRLLLEKKNSPLDFVVYEGSWSHTDWRTDEYGLVTLQKGTNTNFDKEYFGVFLSVWQSEDAKLFRLSPDGQTLYGLTKQGETATFKRDNSTASTELHTTANMSKTWPKVLRPGQEWQGVYTNARLKKSTKIAMQVLEYELDGKRVAVQITAAADARVKGVYRGSLNLAEHAINGFALALKRDDDRLSDITLFDKSWEEKIELRYDASNERLIGRSKDYQGLFSHMILDTKTE